MTRARALPLVSVSLVLVSLLASLVGGCSFRLVQPPPSRADWPNPVVPSSSQMRCTSSIAPAVADTVLFGTLGGVAAIERHSGSPDITLGIALGSIPYLASAIYGYVTSANCRRYDSLFDSQK